MKRAKLSEIFMVSMQIGFTAFGGGASLISFVRKVVVDDKEWIESDTFDQMAIVANIFPGPVIIQLLALIHYKTRGIMGVIASLVPIVFFIPLVFVGSVTLFESVIPQNVLHKITLALIPFILLLTSEYIYTLYRAQLKRNKQKRDWLVTFLLTSIAVLLLYIGLPTSIVILVYLVLIIIYATVIFKKEKRV